MIFLRASSGGSLSRSVDILLHHVHCSWPFLFNLFPLVDVVEKFVRGCVADRLRPTLPLDVELDKERHGMLMLQAHFVRASDFWHAGLMTYQSLLHGVFSVCN